MIYISFVLSLCFFTLRLYCAGVIFLPNFVNFWGFWVLKILAITDGGMSSKGLRANYLSNYSRFIGGYKFTHTSETLIWHTNPMFYESIFLLNIIFYHKLSKGLTIFCKLFSVIVYKSLSSYCSCVQAVLVYNSNEAILMNHYPNLLDCL